jgi:hypothetical protein
LHIDARALEAVVHADAAEPRIELRGNRGGPRSCLGLGDLAGGNRHLGEHVSGPVGGSTASVAEESIHALLGRGGMAVIVGPIGAQERLEVERVGVSRISVRGRV